MDKLFSEMDDFTKARHEFLLELEENKIKSEEERKIILKEQNLSYDDLIDRVVSSEYLCNIMDVTYETQVEHCILLEKQVEIMEFEWRNNGSITALALEKIKTISEARAKLAVQEGRKLERSSRATIAANARHSKSGGSRDKRNKIREVWASGKYTSRDICAEQECGALDMSYATARKALINTPDP